MIYYALVVFSFDFLLYMINQKIFLLKPFTLKIFCYGKNINLTTYYKEHTIKFIYLHF
jgi:hypothetical protein